MVQEGACLAHFLDIFDVPDVHGMVIIDTGNLTARVIEGDSNGVGVLATALWCPQVAEIYNTFHQHIMV